MDNFNINGKIIIGIDHGYGNMKTRHTVFRSGVRSFLTEPTIASDVLEYNGQYYVIGEHTPPVESGDDKWEKEELALGFEKTIAGIWMRGTRLKFYCRK